jgi:His/Glu/Gln/Arg/opine family amino acid ABC transporter permease subunit
VEVIGDWLQFLSRGLLGTFGLAGSASVLTVAFGALIAIARIAPFRIVRILARIEVDLFRSIPLLALLIFFFFGLGPIASQFGIESFWLAVAAIVLIESAYVAEVYRAALESIPPSQWEAARSLGMDWQRTVRLVILPQAVLPSIPATVNLVIAVLKDSALASLIAVGELTLSATILTSRTFRPMEVYFLVALIYLAIILPLAVLASYSERVVERRVGLRLRPTTVAAETVMPGTTPLEDRRGR